MRRRRDAVRTDPRDVMFMAFDPALAGSGVADDLLTHLLDTALYLNGPIREGMRAAHGSHAGSGAWRIEVSSMIPAARGLGSSAAAIVAGLLLGASVGRSSPPVDELFEQRVALEGIVLKPNMVICGKGCTNKSSVDEVAHRTIAALKATVPSAVPGIAFVSGYGWANFGIAIAGFANAIENFSYVVSAVLTPLFLVAGTFFPLDQLPEWAQTLGNLNPLHHCVELVRHAAFGWEGWSDVVSVGVLLLFGFLMWRLAIHARTRKLGD